MKIDYEELEMAMSTHAPMDPGSFYLDTRTGEVLLISDWVEGQARKFADPTSISDKTIRLAWYLLWYDGEVGPELPETEERLMSQQVDAYLERFLAVPQADSRKAYQDMADFADTVADLHLRQLLEMALNGRGAFHRFKDVLYNYPREREAWFAFSDQCWRERIDAWLQLMGVVLD